MGGKGLEEEWSNCCMHRFIAVSSVLVAIALLACMVVLVIRYRKKEEELEVQEERLTEVILENRELKAATE